MMMQQEFEANNLKELITELEEKNRRLLQDYYAAAQTCEEQREKIRLLDARLHWIYLVGADYDGCNTVESLKSLIDELLEFTQMSDEEIRAHSPWI
jgi:hypothetical protein